MSQEMRAKANRDDVAGLLLKAARALREASVAVKDASAALKAVEEAERHVDNARKLAHAAPVGYKPLPAPIRRKVNSLALRMEQAAVEIHAIPITRLEKEAKLVKERRRVRSGNLVAS